MGIKIPHHNKISQVSAAAANEAAVDLFNALHLGKNVVDRSPDRQKGPFIHCFYWLSTSLALITFNEGADNREGCIPECINGSSLLVAVSSSVTAADPTALMTLWKADPGTILEAGTFLRNKTQDY